MSVESIFFKHEETRSKEYADQFDMMLSEQLEKELPMTNCWHCHTPYAFTTTKCPKCNATNANVDFETAQIEQVKELC
jgi:Zn finger protein HypA/HybF involved in hydrogenase expression